MEKENTIKESLSFCLFGTSEQRKISLDLIEKCLAEKGIDISKCESKKASTSDEALPIDDVVKSECKTCSGEKVRRESDGSIVICLDC